MSHPKRPRDPKGPLWRLLSQQGRAVAANSTFRWSHFAYAISWRTSSSVCASLISDRHRGKIAPPAVPIVNPIGLTTEAESRNLSVL
jgi:hypothetical protein